MKKLLSILLAFFSVFLLASCQTPQQVSEASEQQTLSEEPEQVRKYYTPDRVNQLYVDYFAVTAVGHDGFSGTGSLNGEVYVVYPDADRTVHILDTLRVEFYGRHYQKQPTTAALKGEDGLMRQYEFTQTITRVRDVRKSHGEELA